MKIAIRVRFDAIWIVNRDLLMRSIPARFDNCCEAASCLEACPRIDWQQIKKQSIVCLRGAMQGRAAAATI
jgi:hypothetical protein